MSFFFFFNPAGFILILSEDLSESGLFSLYQIIGIFGKLFINPQYYLLLFSKLNYVVQ